ncbi:hypothetical protein Ciccas_004861 [Cichlidogyrus casuarinus]|uniref:Uncharacterized protein n=1 Tax=Cichlidogyrus casuarinus TaxID=1844966 RepID=A0ABD2QAB2_9PLAT
MASYKAFLLLCSLLANLDAHLGHIERLMQIVGQHATFCDPSQRLLCEDLTDTEAIENKAKVMMDDIGTGQWLTSSPDRSTCVGLLLLRRKGSRLGQLSRHS